MYKKKNQIKNNKKKKTTNRLFYTAMLFTVVVIYYCARRRVLETVQTGRIVQTRPGRLPEPVRPAVRGRGQEIAPETALVLRMRRAQTVPVLRVLQTV